MLNVRDVKRARASLHLVLLFLPALAFAQPPLFDAVVGGLRHPDPAVRIKAIRLLKEAAYPEAVVPLAAAIADPDDRVQLEAIDAEQSLFMLEPIARRRRVGGVLEVRMANVGERAFARGPLAVVPRAVPPAVLIGLVSAMRDDNVRVRLEALYAFGIIAPAAGRAPQSTAIREGVGWMVETLRRDAPPQQEAAARVSARVLKDCGIVPMPDAADGTPPPCVAMGDALIGGMNSRQEAVRMASMRALGALRYAPSLKALADSFAFHGRGEAAEAALEGLAGIGHLSSVQMFVQLLGSSDPDIRRLALDGLARADAKSQLPDLERITGSDRSEAVQLALIHAQQRLGAPSRPDRLVAALGSETLGELAETYLIDLSSSAAPALAEFLEDPNPERRAMVADILGFSNDPRIVPALVAAVKDADPGASRAAARALARIRLAAQP